MFEILPIRRNVEHRNAVATLYPGLIARKVLEIQTGNILQKRYRIVSLLGQGGMGAVYLADDNRLIGRRCAIKEQIVDPFAKPQSVTELRQQFQMEASWVIRKT